LGVILYVTLLKTCDNYHFSNYSKQSQLYTF